VLANTSTATTAKPATPVPTHAQRRPCTKLSEVSGILSEVSGISGGGSPVIGLFGTV
jgi:hypothetical protein